MLIKANDIGTAWYRLLNQLLSAPSVVSRGMATRERVGVTLQLEDARNNIIVSDERNLNYRFMIAEWLWIWFGRDDVGTIARYNSKLTGFSDDGVVFFGAYGPRVKAHWDWVREGCRADPGTRQAVIVIYQYPPPTGTRDVPCTLTLQFLPRDGRLHAVVNMRSSDAWLGIPYDVFSFTMLQNIMAAELELEVGSYTLNLGSSHIYERDAAAAEHVLDDPPVSFLRSPKLFGPPPVTLDDALVNGSGAFFDYPGAFERPWCHYARAITTPTRQGAFECLKLASKG